MSGVEALSPRDPEKLMGSALSRGLAFLAVGALGGALGAVLMGIESGTGGHGHGGGGTPFAMLPHQLLLTLPLAVLVVLLTREADARRMGGALLFALLGVLAVDLLLL